MKTMKAQQSPATPTAGVAHKNKLGPGAANRMQSSEAAQGAANTDVAVPLSTLPQATALHLRRCAPTSRTCTTIAVITFAAVGFLIAVCARHLKVHRSLSATNQTRRLASGWAGPCYPPTAGGFGEAADPIAAYLRQLQILSIQHEDAVHLTETEAHMVAIAKVKLEELSTSIEELRSRRRGLEGSIARLQDQLRGASRAVTGPLRTEIQNLRRLIEDSKSNLDHAASQLKEKQRQLAASVWTAEQEVDALLLRVKDHTGSLSVGAARALAATKVVVAGGMQTREVPRRDELRRIERLLQQTLVDAALLSGDLQKHRSSSPESVCRGKLLVQELDNFVIALPSLGLQDYVREARVARERLRGVLSTATDPSANAHTGHRREVYDPQSNRGQRRSTILRRHTMLGGSAYPPRSPHEADYGTLPRPTPGMRRESWSTASGARVSTHMLPDSAHPRSNVPPSRSSIDLRLESWAPASGARVSTHMLPDSAHPRSNVPPSRSSIDLRRESWAPASGARVSTRMLPGAARPPLNIPLSRSFSQPRQHWQPLHHPHQTLPQAVTTLPKRLPLAESPQGSKVTPTTVAIPEFSSRDDSKKDSLPLSSGTHTSPSQGVPLKHSSSPPQRPKFAYPPTKKSPGIQGMMQSRVVTSSREQPRHSAGLSSSTVVDQEEQTPPSTSNGHFPVLTRDAPPSPSPGPASVQSESLSSGTPPVDGDPSTPSGPSKAGNLPGSTEDGGASAGDGPPSDRRECQHPEPGGGQQQPGGSSPPPGEPSSSLGGQPTSSGEDSPPPNRPPTKDEPSGAADTDLEASAQEMLAQLEAFVEEAQPVVNAESNDPVSLLYAEELLKQGQQLLQESEKYIGIVTSEETGQKLAQQREQCLRLCSTFHSFLTLSWMTSLRSKIAVLEEVTQESADIRQRFPKRMPNEDYVELLEKVHSVMQESQEVLKDFLLLNAPPLESSQVSALLTRLQGAITVAQTAVYAGTKHCAVQWQAALEDDAGIASTESLLSAQGPVEAVSLPVETQQPHGRLPEGLLQHVSLLVPRLRQLGVCQSELDALQTILLLRRSDGNKT